ncbi:flagellar basal-body rod protein FlgG [Pelovirga terrestris]|jgi:flagellar basal-body rod protein FlgG|uniref:Flagellar basal-body rod protein FlgG n=1 Tax=Pelovirga terrestris TaxID=2771352 RepID=A0A8J6QRU7_9BACT|nr:flagellar basal-body rod protein FlgG [Pelovirga terrestris]MBD1400450.1 flagellar basal-body rod protein FlgG [Pelovirga terrestris]
MIRALWTAATGMQSQQTNMDVIANNLANVNSSGFKKSRADFQDILYQTTRAAGAGVDGGEVPTGIQIGLGSRVAAVQKVFTSGDFVQTESELDVAIEGPGFFQVILPDGTDAYTRSGALKKDSTGRLVTSDGFPLIPEIVIPEGSTSIAIGSGGTVDVLLDGESTPTEVGVIELIRFGNPSGLKSLGRNLYSETPTTGAPIAGTPGEAGFGSLSQGFLEGSNVNIMEEMVNMIAGQRAYEVNSKTIKTADEMLSITSQLVR